MRSSHSSVQVLAHGASSAGARLWRFRGKLRVTVVVKATFALVHQAQMRLVEPEPIVTDEVHHGNNPVRSVRLTSDLAPYLPRAEVVLTGHAYAPQGRPIEKTIVGIALYDGYERVFDKHLEVQGDMGPEGITPFTKMPLRYERAFGGPGWEDNPFGTGAGGTRGHPNIAYIEGPRRTAGFGPYSAHWPTRKKLVSAEERKALSLPIAEIPDRFDWTYFHAAPLDQRCPYLSGSEWVVLEGLRPEERRVRSRLPAARGRALVFWAGEDATQREPLDLVADTLRIDSDRGTCSVTWRKSFAVEHERHLPELRIVGAVQLGDAPIAWPPPAEVVRRVAVAPEPPASKPPGASTVQLGDDDLEVVSVRAAAPAPAPPPAAEPGRAQPMILGAFRLAVFSPDYEEHPEDPARSTLVFGDRPAWYAGEGGRSSRSPRPRTTPLPPCRGRSRSRAGQAPRPWCSGSRARWS
jgi:hypothetical protein